MAAWEEVKKQELIEPGRSFDESQIMKNCGTFNPHKEESKDGRKSGGGAPKVLQFFR